jgi:hypothetical protein
MSRAPNKKRIEELSEKWLNGTITEAEQQEYDLWYDSIQDHEVDGLSESDLAQVESRIYQSIQEREGFDNKPVKVKMVRLLKRIALIAASIGLFSIAASQFYSMRSQQKNEDQTLLYSAITPGRDRATLSLDNGSVFDLDSLGKGEIFQQSGIRIEKNEKGELIYSVLGSSDEPTEILTNTISTPKGGQYRISLPDGSQVWLNAASRLTFPTVFTGESRRVELVGEAYFEVAQNKKLPFTVITPKEEVEVLGTHFNVNSYRDEESSMVALLEGKVKVSLSSSEFKVLKPGEQTIVKGGAVEVFPVDLSEAVAWKNGEFMFHNESMKSVMQKIARWYDVEVVVASELENISIWGSVSKYENISEVLKIIEMTGSVHFNIEGRRIHVMK